MKKEKQTLNVPKIIYVDPFKRTTRFLLLSVDIFHL